MSQALRQTTVVACVLGACGALLLSGTLRAQDVHGPDEADPDEGVTPAAATATASATAHVQAPPSALPRALQLALSAEPNMVLVPGSTFTFGALSTAAATRAEPRRQELIATYLLDRTEVTVGDYRACVTRKACEAPRTTSASCTYLAGVFDYPINCVTFAQAETYCRAAGKRLPREAEWELAARGNRPGAYPWGSSAINCQNANTLRSEVSGRSCSSGYPLRVASIPINRSVYGAYDLAGNLEEWVQDFYSNDLRHGAPRAGTSHVLRGGSWLTPPSSAKSTARNYASMLEAGAGVGFRCAKDLPR